MTSLHILPDILTDKGSKYAVSGAEVTSRTKAQTVVKELKKVKKFARATHHSWAYLSSDEGPIKQDDGEAGAGMVIIRMLERYALYDHIIIVTRWYGGTKLGGDRFRHIQTCVKAYIENKA